jgi:urease subunit beta
VATRPGEIIPGDGPVELNPGRERVTMVVTNTADRPVQVGSHVHFSSVNPGLSFDRHAAWGRHLDIPAGTSVRFEPGIEREVTLVPLAGARVVPGLRVEWAGALDARSSEPHAPSAHRDADEEPS